MRAFPKTVFSRKSAHNASSTPTSHPLPQMQGSRQLKKKAKRQQLLITTSPPWGLRFFRTGALLLMTQSEVSTGIFLVKPKARKSKVHTSGSTSPCGTVGGLGGIRVPSPKWQTDVWTFLLKERRAHAGKSTPNPGLLVKNSQRGTHTENLEGNIEKARRAGIVTHLLLQQLLTRRGSKMSLKLPRNWEFNLKVEAGRIGTVNVFLLPLGSYTWTPAFACWSTGSLIYLKMDLSENLSLGEICIQIDMLAQSSQTGRGGFFSVRSWSRNRACLRCDGLRPQWGTPDELSLQITHETESFSLIFHERIISLLFGHLSVFWVVFPRITESRVFLKCLIGEETQRVLFVRQKVNSEDQIGT